MHKKIRFIIVGFVNTLVDLLLYGLLVFLGVGFWLANFISTSSGMAVSFSLNKNYTFQSKSKRHVRQVGFFLVITAFSMWVIQPVVIYLTRSPAAELFSFLPDTLVVLLPKCLATLVSLLWNYLWYNNYIFKQQTDNDKKP